MGLVNPALPTVGSDPRGTGESTTRDSIVALLNEFNGNIESANVKDASLAATDMATGATGLAAGSFSAYRAAAQSPVTGAVVNFETEEWDISSWFDVTTNVGRYTPQVAGIYRLSAFVLCGAALAGTNFWSIELWKNAALYKRLGKQGPGGITEANPGGTALVQANGATDFFDVRVVHNFGGATALNAGAPYSYFQGEMVGRS